MSFLQKNISRRSFLGWTFSVALMSQIPCRAFGTPSPVTPIVERSLSLLHVHTGECFHDVYWADGEYLPEALEAIDKIFRDYQTGEIMPIDAELIDLLYGIQAQLSTKESIHIFSGYRTRKTNELLRRRGRSAARNSFHLLGRAVDITVPRVSLATLKKTAARFKAGGVGYYPRFHFIHLDTGPIRFWQASDNGAHFLMQ